VLKAGGGSAPKLLEHGGRGRAGAYRPRPFMGPAMAAELPQAAANFKSLIR
jgi:hypothetical protein